MTFFKITAVVLCLIAASAAQMLPSGTAIPIMLNSTLDARRDKPGQRVSGRIMQDVLLPDRGRIKAGGHVVGHIVSVTKPTQGKSRMVLTFDTLESHGSMPLKVAVRAVASTQDTYNAQIPIDPTSDSESSDEWVMRQVGGETVYRGQGKVISNGVQVGVYKGAVIGTLRPTPEEGCPSSDDNGVPQGLWVFSTTACGVYGLEDMKLVQAGRSAPVGQVMFESDKDVYIHAGSGWLLLVVNPGDTAKATR